MGFDPNRGLKRGRPRRGLPPTQEDDLMDDGLAAALALIVFALLGLGMAALSSVIG